MFGIVLMLLYLFLFKKGDLEIFLSYDGDKVGWNVVYKVSLMLVKE